ncbi:DUF1127 domain-containing protein [Roseibium aggregatum]|uniref:YjiS-like domain-containing protein n=1 Tax=Roseibium aggregatum (strain ATCC 25650 / DSM 13394 / JCM 20685 / NBRC 16684 / NCIMB 2208 / IAM 12614 / B1) TaxID=384765 RepID=A0NP20_ROSAI|nr:DUF1127 domain-containing protein [Roseibium aggregatum]EAV45183.1 hypothetical protein SIAM614_17699 [Roseibium aggregatum IAM 12614]
MSSIETISGRPISRLRIPGGLARTAFRYLREWFVRRRTRLELLELSDAALEDLGLTREAALAEAMRPFWDTESRRKGRY